MHDNLSDSLIILICFIISMLVYLSLIRMVFCRGLFLLYSPIISLNCLQIKFIMFKIGSFLKMLNGIFSRPSKYCRAFDPVSSDFALISFSFCIAFSLTASFTFNKHICCSNGILLISKLDNSFVYLIVFFIASRKYSLIFHVKLSNRIVCS